MVFGLGGKGKRVNHAVKVSLFALSGIPKRYAIIIMRKSKRKSQSGNSHDSFHSGFSYVIEWKEEKNDMGRKNRRKKSAYTRKMKTGAKRLVTMKMEQVHTGCDENFEMPEQQSSLGPHRGDIWFAELGKHPGTSVQEGCRPVFIVSNDTANGHSGTVTVVPMTSKKKKAYLPTHVLTGASDCPNLEPSMVLAEQVTTIGKCALKSFVGRVGESKMHEIEKAVEVHLGITSRCISDRWNACISGKGV